MNASQPQSLDHWLHASALDSMVSELARLQSLTQTLRTLLDPRYADHVEVSSFRQGTLFLLCENATIISQLRYLAKSYQAKLRELPQFSDLQQWKISVRHQHMTNQHRRRTSPQTLSLASKTLLLEAAECMTDPEISLILRKMASRTPT
ncbi:MAG: DUF721 domain-containing protein [Pseudomonadales bacterium]|nr:DUF721 domain-containing protein [Pseudomonadales bacterium]